jgi:uncharacterized cupin superfamily protein
MPNRVIRVADVDLDHAPLPADQVVAGTPSTGSAALDISDVWEAGVWEHTVGTSTDVEADEVFVVISGRASIAIDGGPTLEVGPGDLGILEAGSATTWTVHETLRKVYVTPSSPESAGS